MPLQIDFWESLLIAVLAGALTTLLGFLVPTFRSAAEPPALSSRRRVETITGMRVMLIACITAITFAILSNYCAHVFGSIGLAYAAAMFIFLSIFTAARPLLDFIIRLFPHKGVRLMVATSLVRLNLRASAVAVVAGGCAAALLVGLGVLIESFDISLNRWMSTTLQADAYLRAPATHDSTRPARLSRDVLAWLSDRDDIADLITSSTISLDINAHSLRLEGTELAHALERNKYQFLGSAPMPQSFVPKTDAIFSESAARSLKLSTGQSITIANRNIFIRGVFRDYTSERGLIVLDRSLYAELSSDTQVEAAAIYLRSDATTAQIRAALLRAFPDRAFTFLSNSQLRDLVAVIFQQTFSITAIVRLLVMTICAVGFWMLRMQRIWLARREISTLSVLGVSKIEFIQIAAIEGAILALVAGVLGALGGLYLAWILVRTINPLSFGWTLDFEVSAHATLLPLALLLIASIVAALSSSRFESERGVISDE